MKEIIKVIPRKKGITFLFNNYFKIKSNLIYLLPRFNTCKIILQLEIYNIGSFIC